MKSPESSEHTESDSEAPVGTNAGGGGGSPLAPVTGTTSEIPGAETLMERLRMAVAEAGHSDWRVEFHGEYAPDGWPHFHFFGLAKSGLHERAVLWHATEAVGIPTACWSCTQTSFRDFFDDEDACLAGNCPNPDGPARPPRELLRAAS